ncbi:TPA: hypothetical protein ACPHT2_005477, partial [Vibrio antiquarius]
NRPRAVDCLHRFLDIVERQTLRFRSLVILAFTRLLDASLALLHSRYGLSAIPPTIINFLAPLELLGHNLLTSPD